VKRGISVDVKMKIQLGFLNDEIPNTFNRKQLYISLLIERSDGTLVDFRRMR
jgi:ATP-dependent DNA helicase HFM1/MER3